MTTRWVGRLQWAAVAFLIAAAGGGAGSETPRGLWLLPRKDTANTARADVPGRLVGAPREVWSFGGGGDAFSFCRPVRIAGRLRYFGQVRSGLRLVEPDGRPVWSDACLGVASILGVADFLRTGGVQALVTLGQMEVALVEVADGSVQWTWKVPTGTYLGTHKLYWHPGDSRFVCFPQNTLTGVCFRLPGKQGKPELLWERTYNNAYWQGYGPQIVLADMDNRGLPEVVVVGKPGYAGIIDLDTGALRYEVRYQVTDGPDIGRPYGLLTAQDLDGDGYRDLVVASCQVEEYLAVLRNLEGKGLAHVWSQFIEKDYPEDHLELRPNIASVADVDGDRRRELVLGLFNTTGDGAWHTVVLDPLQGYQARRIDLPGRYCWGCYDLTGDGRAEIVTSAEPTRRTAPASEVQAVDGRTGRDLASVSAARLVTLTGPLENHTAFMALRATPIFVTIAERAGGLLLRRQGGTGPEEIWRVVGGKSVFTPLKAAAGARAVLLSRPQPTLVGVDLAFRGAGRAAGPDAANPRVAMARGQRELIVELSDGRVIGGQPDWSQPGRLRRPWTMPGGLPSIWLGPAGERVVCTVSPRLDEIHLGRPAPTAKGMADTTRILLPYPVYVSTMAKSTPTLVPFGDDALRLFVGLQTGVHTLACALFDAEGKQLWLNPHTGPYPRTAAIARLRPEGPYELIVNDHYNKTIYALDGQTRLSLSYGARDRNNIMYTTPYALPIVGPYGPAGETRILMTPGLDAVQVLDPEGTVLAQRHFSTYEFEYCGSAAATLRPGAWDLGMVNHDGVFHCLDLQTGEWRWTMDLGDRTGIPINVSTVDVDGDGRDNFLVGLPNGSLLALDERDGKGEVLWRLALDAGVRDAFAADLDGDGFAEVIVETDDGRVRVLRGEG